MDNINNLDDLEKYLASVAETDNNITALKAVPLNTGFYARLYGYVCLDDYTNLVYKYDDPKMKLIPWEDTDAFKDLMERLTRWISRGYLAFAKDGDYGSDVAAYFGANEYIEKDTVLASSTNAKGVDAHTYLLGKDLPLLRTNSISSIYNNAGIAISVQSKNAVRTLKFLNWVQESKGNYNLLNYGREGKDYTLDNGLITLPSFSNTNTPYSDWNSTPFKNFNYELNDFYPADTQKDYGLKIQSLLSKAVYAPHNGFFPYYGDIDAMARARSNLFDQNIYYALYNGTFNYSDIARIREDLKHVGTDNIVSVIQYQLNTFMKGNK
ncbi:MAG TPA: hypothetical protein VIK72_04365 [Clostridiaceae bacterium]